ncbi:MAG: hypothetical protein ACXAC0_06070 [Candidatus Thorarchaeota archaeon]|jgi:hypothetical protein
MRKYNTGVSSKVFAAMIAAVVLTAGVFAVAIYFPGEGNGPPPDPTSLGALTAEFLNSKRDNVQFYWMCNSTFVNQDISEYYAQSEPGALVDGIMMNRTSTGGDIILLFSPFEADIIGTGQITTTDWNSLSGTIIDDGIGQMEAPENPPAGDFPLSWPIDFYFNVFFDDDTCFFAGFSSTDGFLYIQNGTWNGEFAPHGWPISTGWDDGAWLLEGGHLTAGIDALYTTITTSVSYPE